MKRLYQITLFDDGIGFIPTNFVKIGCFHYIKDKQLMAYTKLNIQEIHEILRKHYPSDGFLVVEINDLSGAMPNSLWEWIEYLGIKFPIK